ncbi:tetratricopeptide repeat protein [Sphingomonas lutea]|uniref:Tetratricopeptide repeat protein n=1 Tax=Sphingomonas lutea TaxID=1045317 RepID=A0A7G9SIG3_9SPHN|nr:tetratricopeptide repeat protein [Sphingomonas lutea]QNN67638.1 tetratricopeptide repeat protein [Sphingomonas lutea]
MATLGLTEEDRKAIERFQQDVIEPSMTKLVVLDFWAEWCGPCKALGPVLDKVAQDYAGKGVVLAKLDVDKEKLIAAQFRIQSIPTVYAIHQGQPVADLTNYRTEGSLKKALDQLLAQLKIGGEAEETAQEIAPQLDAAEQALGAGDTDGAIAAFQALHAVAPDNPDVVGGLARALVGAGRVDETGALLSGLPDDLATKPEVARARAALELATAPKTETAPLEARLAADPDDHDTRFELASAQMAAGDRDSAADALLEIIQRDREWNDGAARKRFLQLLEAQGLEDPWSSAQRRRLSALLFT